MITIKLFLKVTVENALERSVFISVATGRVSGEQSEISEVGLQLRTHYLRSFLQDSV